MREAAELNKQMDALIALRIKVDRENYSLDSSTTVPLRSSAPSTTMTRGPSICLIPAALANDNYSFGKQ
ncbi:EXS (ERD1/XPR1/SYG1) family protein [Melia azedarach]|uniref:EXS (ERD1/XPR1/SYG1) family protein n=1 Tax=Melia azedarach TaxID=155640 RepID=A0ACC1XJS0_MELAZ|nr:EXS (ERD1/XPR1/SYG1) family protein [Melia azedarach]